MSRSGAELALLLLGGFRSLVDAATGELARRGHVDYRPVHDFAMRAVAAGAGSASELGRRLSVTKQSAARTIAVLQERGYLSVEPDPSGAPAVITVRSKKRWSLVPASSNGSATWCMKLSSSGVSITAARGAGRHRRSATRR